MLGTYTMSSRLQAGDLGAIKSMLSQLVGGDDDDPLASMQTTLDEIRELGGDMGGAADHLSGMLEELAGGIPAMAGALPERQAYSEGVQDQTQQVVQVWTQIIKLLAAASTTETAG